MQDRDKNDWYDPKLHRSDPFNPFPPPPTSGGWLVKLITLAVIGAVFVIIFPYLQKTQGSPHLNYIGCTQQPLPPSGAVSILDPAVMRRSDTLFSAIDIRNEIKRPIAFYLLSPTGDGKRYAVVHVPPGTTAMLSAPVGHYGISLEYGNRWCGDEKGYEDGSKVRVTSNFPNEAGKSGKIIIDRSPTAVLSVSYTHVAPEPLPPVFPITGTGFLDLRQDAGGHYAVNGSISSTPLRFMLDTGATVTSVSNDFALRARIPSCRPTTANTANGVTNACMARVPEITFGNFRVTDVDVMILPRLAGNEALLGMNVLRHFSIEQRGGVMRISAP